MNGDIEHTALSLAVDDGGVADGCFSPCFRVHLIDLAIGAVRHQQVTVGQKGHAKGDGDLSSDGIHHEGRVFGFHRVGLRLGAGYQGSTR